MKKVSIVVPIYNSSSTLRKCLDSILNQAYKDIEVLCINDASTDDSVDIVNEYQKKDKRIILINFTKNQGPAMAKNEGIVSSSGDYIAFVDSDDYIKSNMIETMVDYMEANKLDIVRCHYDNYIDGKLKNIKFPFKTGTLKKKEDKINFVNTLLDGTLPAYMQLMMINKNIILQNNISIGNQYYIEDLMFYIKVLNLTDKIGMLNENLYVYVNNSNGLTYSVSEEKILKRIDGLIYYNENVKKYIKKNQYKIVDTRCTQLFILFLYQIYTSFSDGKKRINEVLKNKDHSFMQNDISYKNYDTFTKKSYSLLKNNKINKLCLWFGFAEKYIKFKKMILK